MYADDQVKNTFFSFNAASLSWQERRIPGDTRRLACGFFRKIPGTGIIFRAKMEFGQAGLFRNRSGAYFLREGRIEGQENLEHYLI